MIRAPSQAALLRAAKVAAAEGVCIVIRVGEAVYEIAPVEKPVEKEHDPRKPKEW